MRPKVAQFILVGNHRSTSREVLTMRRLNISIKLDPEQALRLQRLADQCGITPEQMASAVATLALNRRLGATVPITQPPEQATRNRPNPGLSQQRSNHALPETGFLRLPEIVGYRAKAGQPLPPRLIPVSRSTWLAGVKSGLYPQPVKLGTGVTAWRVEDIRELIENLGS